MTTKSRGNRSINFLEFLMYPSILGWDLKTEDVFEVELQHISKNLSKQIQAYYYLRGKCKVIQETELS